MDEITKLDGINIVKKASPKKESKEVTIPLWDKEKALLEQWKHKETASPLKMTVEKDDSSFLLALASERGSREEKSELMLASLCAATGAKNGLVGMQMLYKCISATGLSSDDVEQHATAMNIIIDMLHALEPKDEFEGMLITRIVALHFQIMEFMRRSIDKNQTVEGADINVNRTAKLTRLYNESLETLMRYRRKGEQKVVVQHVNVNNGGQAIVADTMIAGGGGGFPKN